MKPLLFMLIVLMVALLTGYASAQNAPHQAYIVGGPVEAQAQLHSHRVLRDSHRSLFVYHESGQTQARVVKAGDVDSGGKSATDRIVHYRIIGSHDAIDLDADMRRQEEDPIDENHHLLQVQRLGRYLHRERAHVVRHPIPEKIAAEADAMMVREAEPGQDRAIDKNRIVRAN